MGGERLMGRAIGFRVVAKDVGRWWLLLVAADLRRLVVVEGVLTAPHSSTLAALNSPLAAHVYLLEAATFSLFRCSRISSSSGCFNFLFQVAVQIPPWLRWLVATNGLKWKEELCYDLKKNEIHCWADVELRKIGPGARWLKRVADVERLSCSDLFFLQ
ncbi:hypothetical protein Droror1_Dr00020391 [Drosera rotundifolia]